MLTKCLSCGDNIMSLTLLCQRIVFGAWQPDEHVLDDNSIPAPGGVGESPTATTQAMVVCRRTEAYPRDWRHGDGRPCALHDFGGFRRRCMTRIIRPGCALRWRVWMNCWLRSPSRSIKRRGDLITALGRIDRKMYFEAADIPMVRLVLIVPNRRRRRGGAWRRQLRDEGVMLVVRPGIWFITCGLCVGT